jgi:galactose mutarotase-like enzyme
LGIGSLPSRGGFSSLAQNCAARDHATIDVMARAMQSIGLECDDARAEISPLGAEMRRWRAGGRDLLWTPDPRFWDATAPLLFPVCGWTRDGARVGGVRYPLGLHGFARDEPFEVVARDADRVRWVLRDNARTRAQYPFAFELVIEHRLFADRLRVEASVRNAGDGAMPYAIGLHPGFCWPADARANARIVFDAPETPEVPVIAPGGLFSARRRRVSFADPRTLPISDETFAREALCFLDCASRAVEFHGSGGPRLRVVWEGFNHLVVWSRPGAPFVCIETWSGYGDPENFVGELQEKPGMSLLPPGAVATHAVEYSIQP